MKNIARIIFTKEKLKNRLPFALLSGFTLSFMICLFGVLEIFAANRDEFMFSASDFIAYLTLSALFVGFFISFLIIVLPEKFSLAVFGITVWLIFMGYVQSLFFNGAGSLKGDTDQNEAISLVIINAVGWVITGFIIIAGVYFIKKKDIIKKIYLIALIALFVMQGASCVSRIGDIMRDNLVIEKGQESSDISSSGELTDEEKRNVYLTKQGIDKVSKGNNIITFVIDRFDISYYNNVIESEPEFFNKLDGFTFFYDNISLYSRTWPAVSTMITGIDNDFSTSANAYFEKVYTESTFINDLKANNYKIKLYMPKYYCYRDGTPFVDLAENIAVARGYTVERPKMLSYTLLKLSIYRYAPNILKEYINVSTSSFNGLIELNGIEPIYETDDLTVCNQILDNGLSFDYEEDSYIYIHFNGCHNPYIMDVNAKSSKNATCESQLCGCFKTIYFYLEEMKKIGVYDNSTVIITGDHPSPVDDSKIPTQPRLTALFVKPPKASGKLAYSSAQVSQENLIPTIIKSSGIKTEVDYGLSYFEVPPDKDNVRYHKFELSGEPNQIIKFKITGDGRDFDNWSVDSKQALNGSFYK